jgi:chemotaxis protein methyltransferase CheR
MPNITPEETKIFSKYIYDISGVNIDQSKAYLFESRLARVMEELRCPSYLDLYHKARDDRTKALEQRIVDEITTNETSFFRDNNPFELLQNKILPDIIDIKTTHSSGVLPIPIRIWSSACSTGQEVYSIAIVLRELMPNTTKFAFRLLGTDISNVAIARASRGEYNKFEIERGLSEDRISRYFTCNGKYWKIKDEIRAMASFRKMNLMHPFDTLGKFDIVFCRNVAIYFGLEDRVKLFDKIARIMERDGYLIIGSTESLTTIHSGFEPKRYLRSVFYQLR